MAKFYKQNDPPTIPQRMPAKQDETNLTDTHRCSTVIKQTRDTSI